MATTGSPDDEMQSWGYVKAAIVYELRDAADDPHSRTANFGLIERNGEKKQAYRRFRTAAGALENHEPVLTRERCRTAR